MLQIMAGPSPFGVPRAGQGRHTGIDDSYEPHEDRGRWHDGEEPTVPGARYSAETVLQPTAAPEDDLETQLERIHASRPLRRAAQRARRRTRWWLIALAVISGLAVVAACGAGAYIVLREGESAPASQPAPQGDPASGTSEEDTDAPEIVDPIGARETDGEPLTVEELFGAESFTPAGAAGPYEVLEAEALDDCAEAGLDELATFLADTGCSQAVRATILNAEGDYAATAGVLNMADAEEAEALRAAIDEGFSGGFAALRTEGAGSELGRSPTMVGYNTYGHYLLYVVIGRADGEPLEDADEDVLTIVGDIVDVWLVDQLLHRRTVN
jgi:hypothetical protein